MTKIISLPHRIDKDPQIQQNFEETQTHLKTLKDNITTIENSITTINTRITADAILEALKTVDGPGSGLDAEHATEADHANEADHATEADYANTARNVEVAEDGDFKLDRLLFLGEIKLATDASGTLSVKNYYGPKISSVTKVSNTEVTVSYSEPVIGEIVLAFSRYGQKNVHTDDNMTASHTSVSIKFDALGTWGQLRMILFSLGV